MSLLTTEQLGVAVSFAHTAIGAPEAWLEGYFGRLIERQELLGYWENDKLIATGECRGFDGIQAEYADLGMIVDPSHRGQGLGSRVILTMKSHAVSKGLRAICSAELNNISSQKALARAGFYAYNRILQFY